MPLTLTMIRHLYCVIVRRDMCMYGKMHTCVSAVSLIKAIYASVKSTSTKQCEHSQHCALLKMFFAVAELEAYECNIFYTFYVLLWWWQYHDLVVLQAQGKMFLTP